MNEYEKTKQSIMDNLKTGQLYKPPVKQEPSMDDMLFEEGTSLKKDDLKKYEYLQPIREYMIERKGVDYKDKNEDAVVEDFVEHMRFFNANTISTAGEVRFISKADDKRKAKAKRAYQIYDQLGNVFVNDGLMGAVGGVWDYVSAAAVDPSNYLGIATGGIARAGALGTTAASKAAIRTLVRNTGAASFRSGATKEAAKEAAKAAGIEAARRAVKQGFSVKASGRLYEQVAKKVANEGRRGLAKAAMRGKESELKDLAAKRSLKYTVGLDASAAVLQDVMAQQVMLDVGAQDSFSALQSGFSALLGGVAGGAQMVAGKAKGASGLDSAPDVLKKVAEDVVDEATPLLSEKQSKRAAKILIKEVMDWNKKVESGSAYSNEAMPAQLIKNFLVGKDGKSGLALLFKEKGYKIGRETKHLSDLMTNVIRFLPQEELNTLNNYMQKSGIMIGDLSASNVKISDMLAYNISEAGKSLNALSQFRKVLDTSIVRSSDLLDDTLSQIETKEQIGKELKRVEGVKYAQSVWKRLLVSSPATTAINVAGFSQYFVGQTLADAFSYTGLFLKGMSQLSLGGQLGRVGAEESFRRAKALRQLQAQKMRNLLDPYTTHDAYMKFLDNNKDIQKILFETVAGGIERTSTRYGIDPNSKLFKQTEAVATAAGEITGVRIQDSFTKSQMFMTEMDKHLRLQKNTTLKEVLESGRETDIDDGIIQAALDTTLKSVFAKDYGTDDQLLKSVAKIVENFSNLPAIGTILPFGRFFNNVVATSYQWSLFGGIGTTYSVASRIVRKGKAEGITITETEALARSLVGTSTLLLAMQYDKERQKKGLGMFEVEGAGGSIIDAKNTFPFSVFLAAGRVGNLANLNFINPDKETSKVPPEAIQELLTQVAVGQFSKDVEFANDLNNVLDVFLNADEAARGANLNAFSKLAGNMVAGVTRPIDAVNKIAGFAFGTDTAKDVRQAEGFDVFTQSATKYMDNILEAFTDKTDAITGEELRVATREGELYDANPFARIFGLTIKPGKTATEKAYSMAEMFPWTANERTKIPAYDRAFNELIAPVLERRVQKLLDNKEFKDSNINAKRKALRDLVSTTKSELRKVMTSGALGQDNMKLRLASKIMGKPREIRMDAQKLINKTHGVTGTPKELEYKELHLLLSAIEYLTDIYEEVGKI
jgi:hypothetical protein